MKTKDYKEIAGMVKSIFDDIESLFSKSEIEDEPQYKGLKEARINEFADYFEKEVDEQSAIITNVIENDFNRQQFLKEAGVK